MTDVATAYLTQREVGRLLPISRKVLREAGRLDDFFAPDLTSIAGLPAGLIAAGGRRALYHRDHVQLIDAVLAERMTLEQARVSWQLAQARMKQSDRMVAGG